MPLSLTLYTRPGCHLCEDAEEWLCEAAAAAGAELLLVSILDDLAVYERYKWRIPVVEFAGRAWEAPLPEAEIRAALAAGG
ncbi:MAG TPA: glutaredoxin family protein [Herpetosiphonaceae bacterium]